MSDLRLTDLTQATGITINDLLHIVIPTDISQDPAGSSYKASVEQLYDGLSGYCVPDLYVSNLHSCSPLNINPLDEGGVYFGSTSGITLDVTNKRIGINTSTPQYALDIKGSQSNLYYDPTSVGGNFVISGSTGIPRMGMTIPAYLTKPTAGFNLGMRAWDDVTFTGYGKVGDAFFYAGNQTNGFNILNPVGTGTEDYIRFYAGQTANGTTSDIHIQGSGSTRGYVGIGTEYPTEKLHVSGTSFFKTDLLTTGSSPSFYYLDGVSTPTDTSTIKSIYKEFRPTTTSSSNVVGDGTLLYPNITSPTNGEFYSKANLILYTDDLSLLNSNEALTSEINVVQIQTNTGTYNDIVKSSSSVLRNLTAGGTINEYVGFWMNGFDITLTHNGSTNNIYGFYMDDQSTRSGNIPPPTNRWGIYIKDAGYNYIAGYLGIGTTTPSEKLHVSGNTIISSGLTASTLNLSSTPAADTGLTTNYLTRDGATGEVKVKTIPGPTAYGLFTQTGDSATVSATTVETTLIDGGVGTLLVPPNGFSIGDSFRIKMGGVISNPSNNDIRIRLKSGSVDLGDSLLQNLSTHSNDTWCLDIDFIIRNIGGTGTASIMTIGSFATTKKNGGNIQGFSFENLNNTTFNTTISNTLDITVEWGQVDAGDIIYSRTFVLNKIY